MRGQWMNGSLAETATEGECCNLKALSDGNVWLFAASLPLHLIDGRLICKFDLQTPLTSVSICLHWLPVHAIRLFTSQWSAITHWHSSALGHPKHTCRTNNLRLPLGFYLRFDHFVPSYHCSVEWKVFSFIFSFFVAFRLPPRLMMY